jgi:integrase/transcriptional regulator with XRE-family HTH domain
VDVTEHATFALGASAFQQRKKVMKINDLGNFRYSITGLKNGASPPFGSANLVSLTVTMSATYTQLIQAHIERLQRESTSSFGEQIAKNHMTALRGMLKSLGKSESSPIGEELASGFPEMVRTCLAGLAIGERSKSDRRSMLNAWRMTFDLLGAAPALTVRGRERRSASSSSPSPTAFEQGLKGALRKSGLPPKRAAQLAGVSPSALGRWSRGALPNIRSIQTLGKLESVLNLPVGHLEALLLETLGKQAPLHHNPYRERLKARCSDPYYLKPAELRAPFVAEWEGLLKHKSAIRSFDKQRHAGGRWSSGDAADAPSSTTNLTTLDGKYYASAGVVWTHTSGYLGFLQRGVDMGGLGIEHGAAQTLAWLVVPEAIDAYLEFLTERSGGLRHTGHSVFCGFVASLTHPVHGYLLQSSELMSKLPDQWVGSRSWTTLCALARSTAGDWKSVCIDVSRDPTRPIQFLLDQPNPLEPVLLAMQRLRGLGNQYPAQSVDEALARRDELLLGLLLSNPLRRKNLIHLNVRPDNSGNVYKSATGEWRIRLPRADFKNGKRGARRSQPYDVAIAPWLQNLVSDYVEHFRPVLARESILDRFFLSRRGTPFHDMTHRVLVLTRQLIPGSGGFGPHAFRHLVATDWLRRNPNDYLTVAELLNDTLEVVMSTYAHLKQDDALTRHSDQLDDLLPNYLRR